MEWWIRERLWQQAEELEVVDAVEALPVAEAVVAEGVEASPYQLPMSRRRRLPKSGANTRTRRSVTCWTSWACENSGPASPT